MPKKPTPKKSVAKKKQQPATEHLDIVFKAKDNNQYGPADMEDVLDEHLREVGQGWVNGGGTDLATGDQDLGVTATGNYMDTVVTLVMFLRELKVGKNTVINVNAQKQKFPVWKKYK